MAPGLLVRIILRLCEESNEKHKGTLGVEGMSSQLYGGRVRKGRSTRLATQ